MRVICCSCGIYLRDTPSTVFNDDAVSHGLCVSCAGNFIAQSGMSLPQYIETLPVPVLTVAPGGYINSANKLAMRFLEKTPLMIQGSLGGELFECEYSWKPGDVGRAFIAAVARFGWQ